MTDTRTNLIIIGDFGKDQDDEMTLVVAKALHSLGHINLCAVVANLSPSRMRARLAKGTLNQLAMPLVPVGTGSDCGVKESTLSDHEFKDISYLASATALNDGQRLLKTTLSKADDKSITLLLISGLTDAAQLLKSEEGLVLSKVERVVIMGGVKSEGDSVTLDENGFIQPDSAANNNFDPEAAQYLYRRLQEIGIPMVILTRSAVYACKVSRQIYDLLAETDHKVGVKLRDTQMHLSTRLWKLANLPADDPQRERLPARCDRQWFLTTFCGVTASTRSGDDAIWDLVTTFCLYDPMALIAATTSIVDDFFTPETVTVNGTEHAVIGVSETKHGVNDPERLTRYLTARSIQALVESC